jgi:hypothetical protein
MGTGSFPEVKRPGRDVHHPPPSSAEVKERVVIPLLPLWAFMACSRVNLTLHLTFMNRKDKDRIPKLTLRYKSNGRTDEQPIQKTVVRDLRTTVDEHTFGVR